MPKLDEPHDFRLCRKGVTNLFVGNPESAEGHRLRRTSFNHTCVRHRAGSACPRDCAVCGKQHVSPPFIHGKSRMRKRARTDLRGAIRDGRPYRDNNRDGQRAISTGKSASVYERLYRRGSPRTWPYYALTGTFLLLR